MKEGVVIRLDADQQGLEWGWRSAEPSDIEQGFFKERGRLLMADLVALAEVCAEREVLLLLPANRVNTFHVEAPTKNRAQLEKAIPYILEEQVVDQVEKLHFAMGSIDSDGTVSVNVIERDYLESVLVAFEDAGIAVSYCLSEVACLPIFDDAWSVFLADELVLVRENARQCWFSDKHTVPVVTQWKLQQLLEEQQEVVTAARVFHQAQDLDSAQELFSGVAGLAVQQHAVSDTLEWLTQGFIDAKQSAINLLQQHYAVKANSGAALGRWKMPLIAASVLLVAFVGFMASQLIVMSGKRDAAEQKIVSLAQQVIPSVSEGNNAIIRLDGMVKNLGRATSGDGGSFTALMAQVFSGLDMSKITLSQIDYQAKRGSFSFDAQASSYEVLSSIQSSLEKQRLQVEMRNASERNGQWSARINIKVGS